MDQRQYVLKLWGSTERPIKKEYLNDSNDSEAFKSVGFNKRVKFLDLRSAIRPGTRMVLYAVKHQRVVGISEATSEVRESRADEHKDEYGCYPFCVEHKIILLVPLCSAPRLAYACPSLKKRQLKQGCWQGKSYVPITYDDYKTINSFLHKSSRFLVHKLSQCGCQRPIQRPL